MRGFKVYEDTLYCSCAFWSENGMAKWDGTNWNKLGNGFSGGSAIECSEFYNNKLFVGGGFDVDDVSGLENLTFWNDTIWAAVDGNNFPSADVSGMKSFDNKLFMGGDFATVGSLSVGCMVAWDGTNWLNVGDFNWLVFELEEYNNELYAGGVFTGVGGVPAMGIAKWEGGTTWSAVGGSLNGYVKEMQVDTFNNFLYAGGAFYVGSDFETVMRWDGFNWFPLQNGPTCDVMKNSMAMYHGELYVGTCIDTLATGMQINYITRWNGNQWDSIPCGTNVTVFALETYRDTLYVGGQFDTAGCMQNFGIAKFYMPPDGSCNYLQPLVNTVTDTFYLVSGEAEVQFYNNNAYVDTWAWDFGDTGISTIKDPSHIYTDTGTYTVEISVTHSTCNKIAHKEIVIVLGTGIPEIEDLNFKVYPNPSDKFFNVEIDLYKNLDCELRISGLNGHTKTIIPLKSSTTKINTDGWSSGAYVCNLFMDGKLVKTEKIIIQ